MTLKEKLDQDLKGAMKSGDKLKVSTIRQVKASIKNKEIDQGKPLEDDGVISVILSAVKQRKDSIEQFEKGGRQDLVNQEKSEMQILTSYLPHLPQQMGDEEIKQEIRRAIQETGASSPKDLGKIMKVLMPRLKGKAEGETVNRLVREILQ